MGQGTTRLGHPNGSMARVRQLGHETEEVRRELDGLVSELDRRRHHALDWRLQMRRHPRALALAASGIAVAMGLIVTVSVARRRRHQAVAARLFELAEREHLVERALRSLAESAERLTAPPSRRQSGNIVRARARMSSGPCAAGRAAR
jgi:hypothetical protein